MNLICGLIHSVINHMHEVTQAVVDGFGFY